MKTIIKNTVLGLFTLVLLLNANTAAAKDFIPGAELKVAGSENDQPVLELKLNNKVEGKYMIVIKDEFGYTLYQKVVKGANISRKFQLDQEELSNVKVHFEIVDLATSNSTVFDVKNLIAESMTASIVKN